MLLPTWRRLTRQGFGLGQVHALELPVTVALALLFLCCPEGLGLRPPPAPDTPESLGPAVVRLLSKSLFTAFHELDHHLLKHPLPFCSPFPAFATRSSRPTSHPWNSPGRRRGSPSLLIRP